MIINYLKDQVIKENPHNADVREMLNTDNFQVMYLKLDAGQSLKPHKTPVDAFFYVLEGEPEVEIENERVKVSKDGIAFSPAKKLHCIYNPSDKEAMVLVVKAGK